MVVRLIPDMAPTTFRHTYLSLLNVIRIAIQRPIHAIDTLNRRTLYLYRLKNFKTNLNERHNYSVKGGDP